MRRMKPITLPKILSDLEDAYIAKAMGHTQGNVTQAAKLLGLNRTTLIEKIKRKELPYQKLKVEVAADPQGEFTYVRDASGKHWNIFYKGERIAIRSSLADVRSYFREKLND